MERQQLHPEHEHLLASWTKTFRVEIRGLGEVLFCHATPRNDTEIFTRLTSEDCLLPAFEEINVPVVICGHTHMQFDRTIGRIRVVNAGSVGMRYCFHRLLIWLNIPNRRLFQERKGKFLSFFLETIGTYEMFARLFGLRGFEFECIRYR